MRWYITKFVLTPLKPQKSLFYITISLNTFSIFNTRMPLQRLSLIIIYNQQLLRMSLHLFINGTENIMKVVDSPGS